MFITSPLKSFTATAADGKVQIDGPGISALVDQRTAREFADQLHCAAGEARRQSVA